METERFITLSIIHDRKYGKFPEEVLSDMGIGVEITPKTFTTREVKLYIPIEDPKDDLAITYEIGCLVTTILLSAKS